MGIIYIVSAMVFAKKTKEKLEKEKKSKGIKKGTINKKQVKSIKDIKINHGIGSLDDRL